MRPLALAAALLPLAAVGCVDRIISIRSEPSGAEVWLDGERKGTTPHDEHYAYYGTRELVLIKPGYRTNRQTLPLDSPWWQIFPFDFVTDVVIPFTLTDRVEVHVVLEKELSIQEAAKEALQHAEEARQKASARPDDPR